MNRRDFHRLGTIVLGGLIKLAVAVPAAAFLLNPLRKPGTAAEADVFEGLVALSQLKVGVPESFGIVRDQVDAWVKYPKEPAGAVWLVRQPEGAEPAVIAYSAECPHLGCAINLADDAKHFICPCHTSAFDLEGKPQNFVPPRPMDRLDVELSKDADPMVRVRFQRFRTLAEEKIPLA
ncbi:ubiquinol-cytochrome c reductase iron-sulfur subunit [Paludisphaera mucosa]|uniref:Rieske 2Fe-2S domain-containing protein n=1 Tax=Paludisphaera mucosa TaxID=3030827 RepID=A0ABT6FG23_9BACT|nr:Rieske 2Fe-2S domain-containing protein [Paludisphaera mucosa]MDG3006541.1 Rieske 2Fe-2S domain-containing protein [Paludisphaera mucosa]